MTDEIPTLNQAQRAHKGPSFDAAIEDCRRKLGLAGAVGTVTFVLYADGSVAFKPLGTVNAGFSHVIADWGANSLRNYAEQAGERVRELQGNALAKAVRPH